MPVAIDLSGKVALVTGSSRGIGAATARLLHQAGADVVVNHPGPEGSDDARAAAAFAAGLERDRAASALVEAADVRDADAVEALMARVRDWRGGLDLLVNNAGILRDRTVAKMSAEEWRDVIDVNLTGVFHGCKFGLAVMRDGGSVVNLSSLSASAGFVGQANYAAAKAGVTALTRVLSKEAAKRSIRVNAVAPGLIDTAMTATIPEPARSRMLEAIPGRRLGRPEEVAAAVLFLCSPLAAYVNGTTLEVDGGWHL